MNEGAAGKNIARDLVFVTLVGVLLSRFSVGSLVMTVPLLLVAPRVRRKGFVWLSFILLFVGAIGWTVLESRELLTSQYACYVAFSLFMPACTLVGSAMWTASESRSRVGLRRFFLACLPVAVLGFALAIWFSTNAAEPTKELLKSLMLYLFPEETVGGSIEAMVSTVVSVLSLVFVPMGMVYAGLPILVSELILYRNDEVWQYDFAFMKLPDAFVWFLLGGLAVSLGLSFMDVPTWLFAVSWNLVFAIGVLYAVQGVSILVALFRRRTAAMSAGRVIVMVLVLCMIPGVNVACLLGLPILGALETWVRFR